MMLMAPYRYAVGGPAAPQFTAGTNITLSGGNTTVSSSSGWVTSPVDIVIPSSGKTFVEFTVGAGPQMLGVMVGSTPQTNYLGSFADSVSNGDNYRIAGTVFTQSVSGDVDSTSSDFGVSIDQGTGKIKWYVNGTVQTPEASFTPGTAGLHFAAGVFAGRPAVTVKASSSNTPSGFTYLA